MHENYLASLVDELAARDIAIDQLAGLRTGQAEAGWLTAERLAGLIVEAAHLSGDPGFGLAFGLRLNLASHGDLGYALMSCRNGEQLMLALTRFARLVVPGIELTRGQHGEQFELQLHFDAPEPARMLLLEVISATLISGARALFNRKIPGGEVWFDFPAPEHRALYQSLGIPVRFDAPFCALVCDVRFLGMPLPGANPVLAEIGNRQVHAMLREMQARQGVSRDVRLMLLRANGNLPELDAVASRVGLSPRTLRRKLHGEGTSFRELVDEVRFELARRYLDTGQIPVGEVAALLGYEDPANFRRAFRRWSGMSPAAYTAARGTMSV